MILSRRKYQWCLSARIRCVDVRACFNQRLDRLDRECVRHLNDRFVQHCEPDQLLATLIETGSAPIDGAYLPRFTDFLHRYRKAAAWGLTEPADRLRFCELSYRYGAAFDEHNSVRAALEERMHTDSSMAACEENIHPTVWEQLLVNVPKGE